MPRKPVVALVGDGALGTNGLPELITVADRWRTRADPRFVVLVPHDRDLRRGTRRSTPTHHRAGGTAGRAGPLPTRRQCADAASIETTATVSVRIGVVDVPANS
ncbi:hypothetical protein LZG04_15210 [Saccharothrix sp. S26]|uniref:hypothetical protein n=1 Tax=Saccharothrix sp. S26 TaxID=2907215 RepID=UPI001F24040F|nr:hypothetical protein [Saccharothrix sp. S26]MCE6996142.1 hypothetical protein [Saccharothrix sp. S26]